MASYSLVPRDGADFRATLESLLLNFDFSNDILEALVKQKIKNLEEFRYFFESESEIGLLWVQKLSLGEHQSLQTAFQHADAGRVKARLRYLRLTWMISSMTQPLERHEAAVLAAIQDSLPT